jgi:hypothetical protein
MLLPRASRSPLCRGQQLPLHRCSTLPLASLAGLGGAGATSPSLPSSDTIIWPVWRPRVLPTPNSRKIRHRSRADAGGMGPNTLHGLNAVAECCSDQPRALSCRIQRGQPTTAASERRQFGLEPVFGEQCRRRSTQRSERVESRLRTELRTAPPIQSRALGPMLTASARELWPFFGRFGAAVAPGTF